MRRIRERGQERHTIMDGHRADRTLATGLLSCFSRFVLFSLSLSLFSRKSQDYRRSVVSLVCYRISARATLLINSSSCYNDTRRTDNGSPVDAA